MFKKFINILLIEKLEHKQAESKKNQSQIEFSLAKDRNIIYHYNSNEIKQKKITQILEKHQQKETTITSLPEEFKLVDNSIIEQFNNSDILFSLKKKNFEMKNQILNEIKENYQKLSYKIKEINKETNQLEEELKNILKKFYQEALITSVMVPFNGFRKKYEKKYNFKDDDKLNINFKNSDYLNINFQKIFDLLSFLINESIKKIINNESKINKIITKSESETKAIIKKIKEKENNEFEIKAKIDKNTNELKNLNSKFHLENNLLNELKIKINEIKKRVKLKRKTYIEDLSENIENDRNFDIPLKDNYKNKKSYLKDLKKNLKIIEERFEKKDDEIRKYRQEIETRELKQTQSQKNLTRQIKYQEQLQNELEKIKEDKDNQIYKLYNDLIKTNTLENIFSNLFSNTNLNQYQQEFKKWLTANEVKLANEFNKNWKDKKIEIENNFNEELNYWEDRDLAINLKWTQFIAFIKSSKEITALKFKEHNCNHENPDTFNENIEAKYQAEIEILKLKLQNSEKINEGFENEEEFYQILQKENQELKKQIEDMKQKFEIGTEAVTWHAETVKVEIHHEQVSYNRKHRIGM